MLNPFPLEDAIRSGCTDILVLLSYPVDYVRTRLHWSAILAYDLLCSRGRGPHAALIRNYPAVDRRVRDIALGRSPVPEGVRIATIVPASGEIGRTHLDGVSLWKAAIRSCEQTLAVFGKSDVRSGIRPPRRG